MQIQPNDVPVFVLCGGLGTRLKEETEFRPKPMVPVGNVPILWHIMNKYSRHGFKRFILCLGYKAEVIKDYFLNYSQLQSDFTIDLKSNAVEVHSGHGSDWTVTLAGTGEKAMTGARVAKAAARYLGPAQTFAVTYGDGLTSVDLAAELGFHLEHGKIGTVLGVHPPSRFGRMLTDDSRVTRFEEKPVLSDNWINGGYFFFNRSFLPYLSSNDPCVLEQAPLVSLANDGQLEMFRHSGFWACMDTQRDRDLLDELWRRGDAPWTT